MSKSRSPCLRLVRVLDPKNKYSLDMYKNLSKYMPYMTTDSTKNWDISKSHVYVPLIDLLSFTSQKFVVSTPFFDIDMAKLTPLQREIL
jgi:hypothetical protein